MKLKKSDLSLLLGVVVLIGAAAFYWYASMVMADKTEALKNENLALQSEVAYLQDLMNHKEEYIAETEIMRTEIDNIVSQFPADVKTETQIMYANNLELNNAIYVETVEMPGKEMVSIAEPVAATATEATAEAVDSTATEATAEAVDSTAETTTASSMSSTILLYRSPTTITFQSTYKSIKDVVKAINEDTKDRKSIDSLELAFDKETGNLTGTLVIQMYSMEGTDSEYVAPSISGVKKGSTNIFGTAENVNALKSTTTDKSGQATAEETDSTEKENAAESTKEAE